MASTTAETPANASTAPEPKTTATIATETTPAVTSSNDHPPAAQPEPPAQRRNSGSSSGRGSKDAAPSEPDHPRGPLNETFKFFLANLPPSVTAGEMRRHFEAYGEVNYVKLIYNKVTGISMGYGFLYLMDEDTDRRVEEYAARNNFRIRFANFSRIYLQRNDRSRTRPLRFKSSHDENVPHAGSHRHHHGGGGGRRDGRGGGGDYGHYGNQGGPPPHNRGGGGGRYYGRDEPPPRNDFHEGPPPRQQHPGRDRGPPYNGPPRGLRGDGGGPHNAPPDHQYYGGGGDHQGHQYDAGYNGGPPIRYPEDGYAQPPSGGGNHASQPFPREGESYHQGHGAPPPPQQQHHYPDQQQSGHWDNGGGYHNGGGSYSPPRQPARDGPAGPYAPHDRQPEHSGPPVKVEPGYEYSNAPPSDGGRPPNGYHGHGYPPGDADRKYSQGGPESADYGYSHGQGPPANHSQGPPPPHQQGYDAKYSNGHDYGYSNPPPHGAAPTDGYTQRNPDGYPAGDNREYDDHRHYNHGYDEAYQQGHPAGGHAPVVEHYPPEGAKAPYPADGSNGYGSWNENQLSHPPQGGWNSAPEHSNGPSQPAPAPVPSSSGHYGPPSSATATSQPPPQQYSHGGKGRGGGASNSQRYQRRDRPY